MGLRLIGNNVLLCVVLRLALKLTLNKSKCKIYYYKNKIF